MTSIVSRCATRSVLAVAVFVAAAAAGPIADEPMLSMRATVVGAATGPLTIELLRWSTDAERAPLLTALNPPPPPPPEPASAAGRGGRGGRGRGAAAPLSPAARMSAAVKAAPTVGFIWGDGPTGYSIKYAWREGSSDAPGRMVFVLDRRLGANTPSWPQVLEHVADAEFTVLEMRFAAAGKGEGKVSLTPVADASAQTLAVDGYAQAPVLLEVTR